MVALPENILTQITNFGHKPRLQRCYLVATDLPGGPSPESPPWGDEAIAFQYWPETLTDSRTNDWTPRAIPGGSHPIYQWTHGGERTLSFTAIFTTDTNPGDNLGSPAAQSPDSSPGSNQNAYELVQDQPLNGLDVKHRDIDLRTVVSWLRWFTYPKYNGSSGGESYRVFEPAKALLVMPNTSLGYDGSDFVLCVMRSCNVTYQAWFPSGLPRIIEVQLDFAEVVQSADRVGFHSRSDMGRSTTVANHFAVPTDTEG